MTRIEPPQRRILRTVEVLFSPAPDSAPLKMHVGIGYWPPVAEAAPIALEVFIRGGGKMKVGSERDFLLDDIAVLISLLLQFGMRPAAIKKALGVDGTDPARPLSLISAASGAVIEDERAFHAELGFAPARSQPEAAE